MKNVAILDTNALVRLSFQHLFPPDIIRIRGLLNRFNPLQIMLDANYLDVVVMELFDNDYSAVEGLHFINKNQAHWETVKLIIFTEVEEPFLIKSLIKLKPFAVVSKKDSVKDLKFALLNSAPAAAFRSPEILKKIAAPLHKALSVREIQILSLIIANHTVQEVSEMLNISCKTVYIHKYNIMKKAGVKRLFELSDQLMKYSSCHTA
ncbi:LuxR C-terminal-related transcriptional regulator [uncultured Pluralibacter sp.]|uniref:LuxR C-terminal-related transcriptional regulator n=1 Tax=uncultured Pluralibacter sp. TaxID=1490864 RepID=UPI00262EA2CD|nr:LuxR C-terminal-related transcriptional regulator [uncultured Pluralibacter sp.]